jgi:hypothetical protein
MPPSSLLDAELEGGLRGTLTHRQHKDITACSNRSWLASNRSSGPTRTISILVPGAVNCCKRTRPRSIPPHSALNRHAAVPFEAARPITYARNRSLICPVSSNRTNELARLGTRLTDALSERLTILQRLAAQMISNLFNAMRVRLMYEERSEKH